MNLEAFLKDVLTPLLDHPEDLRVEVKGEGRKCDVLIHADRPGPGPHHRQERAHDLLPAHPGEGGRREVRHSS